MSTLKIARVEETSRTAEPLKKVYKLIYHSAGYVVESKLALK